MKRLFQNNLFLGILIIALIAIEYYCFIAVKVAFRFLTPKWRLSIYLIYFIFVLLNWWLIFNFRSWNEWSSPIIRNFISPIMLGVFFGKIIITSIMFFGDLFNISNRLYQFVQHSPKTIIKNDDSNHITRSEFLARMALLTSGVVLGGFVYGVSNKYNFKLKRLKLSYPDLPKAFNGLKIVQFSDTHVGSFDNIQGVEKGIAMIMAQSPDIIVFTGDLVNNKYEEMLPYKKLFSSLKAPLGVYAVLGNHDYGDYVDWVLDADKVANLNSLKELISDMGWELLLNKHIIIENENQRIGLIGVENWSNRANFPKYGDLNKAIQGLDTQNVGFNILLSHDPSHFEAEVQRKYRFIKLTLSGHTHGMQFGIKIPGFKWSPVQYIYKYWDGLYEIDTQKLYVNPGFGFIGYKGRVGILPEITVLQLTNN